MRTVRIAGLLVLVGAALRVAGLFLPFWGGGALADEPATLVRGLVQAGVLGAAGALTLTRPGSEFAAGLSVGAGWFVAALDFHDVLWTIDAEFDTGAGFLLVTAGAILALAGAVTLSMGAVPTRRAHAVGWGVLAGLLGAASFAFPPYGGYGLLIDQLNGLTVRTTLVMVVAAALPLAATRLGELGSGVAAAVAGVFASQVAFAFLGADETGEELALGFYLGFAAGVTALALAVRLLGAAEEESGRAVRERRAGTDAAP